MANRLLFILLTLVTTGARAADAAAAPGWGELLRVTFTLGLIVVLILGLSVAVRRWQGERRFSPEVFKVLAAISLGSKEKIYLIQVGNEQIVVGSSLGRMTTLHTMKDNIVLEDAVNSQLMSHNRFGEVLRSLGKGFHQ
ncbi:MAG: flagellar biosynthetic protein FliO [Pseudomonadota bacterium]